MGRVSTAFAFGLLLSSAWPSQATVIAESRPSVLGNISDFAANSPYIPAQTFIPAVSGWLSSLELPVGQNGPEPELITVGLREVGADGAPAELLGTAILASPVLPSRVDPTWVLFDFSSLGIFLNRGTTYAFTLTAGSSGVGGVGVFGSSDSYPGGAIYSSWDYGRTWYQEQYDWGFRISGAAVPEPGMHVLLALGIAGLIVFGGQRKVTVSPDIARIPARWMSMWRRR